MLGRVGGVEARDHILYRRPAIRLPKLPPLCFDDATASGRGLLLELAGGRVWPHDALVAVHHVLGESRREEEFAIDSAGIFDAQHRDAVARLVVAHRQHDVVVAELLVEDDAGHVLLVQSLHDDDDGAALGVRETGRDRFEECGHLALAQGFR